MTFCSLVLFLAASASPVDRLGDWLREPAASRQPLREHSFATEPLSPADARQALEMLWLDRAKGLERELAGPWQRRTLRIGERELRFDVRRFGSKPSGQRALFISLHGGGDVAKTVNDRQWENQKQLYRPDEGIYIAPRAPTDAWNMWHQSHIDGLLRKLIVGACVLEGVDPNRVYLTGYSAGGDGVYQLAPRLADRFAAAAMMAGHPNNARPENLRNLPFAIYVGEMDDAFGRSRIAAEWAITLGQLRHMDPTAYPHAINIVPGKGHWMDRADAVAIGWLAKFTRDPFPHKVVWLQPGIRRDRFYWLAGNLPVGANLRATIIDQNIHLEMVGVQAIELRLHDRLLDLDRPIRVAINGRQAFEGKVDRTLAAIDRDLAETDDPSAATFARIAVAKRKP